jgi:predicted SnoaL-like aldol condensation-catalyzing enzyme
MRRRTLIAGLALAGAAPLVSKAGAASPSIAARFAAALGAHDLAAFAALFADDYVNHQVSAAAPPPGGVAPKAATVAFFGGRLKGLPDLTVSIEAALEQGDLVAASFVYEGTHQGVYFGVAPTGRRLRFTSCDIFRVADDRIVEHWGMGDIAGVLAQLKG